MAKVEFILNFSPSEIPDLGASKWWFPGSRFVITLNPASRPYMQSRIPFPFFFRSPNPKKTNTVSRASYWRPSTIRILRWSGPSHGWKREWRDYIFCGVRLFAFHVEFHMCSTLDTAVKRFVDGHLATKSVACCFPSSQCRIATPPLTHIWWASQILGDTWSPRTRVFLSTTVEAEKRDPWERGWRFF